MTGATLCWDDSDTSEFLTSVKAMEIDRSACPPPHMTIAEIKTIDGLLN